MKTEYKLIGLSRPSSATLEHFDKEESFNAKYEFDEKLWNYVDNNWANVNLKAIVKHQGNKKNPIDPIVIKVLPIEGGDTEFV